MLHPQCYSKWLLHNLGFCHSDYVNQVDNAPKKAYFHERAATFLLEVKVTDDGQYTLRCVDFQHMLHLGCLRHARNMMVKGCYYTVELHAPAC